MGIPVIHNLQHRVRVALQAVVGSKTPPAGEIYLFADTTSKHVVQKDANGKVIDLAAVSGQQDSVGFDTALFWTFNTGLEGWVSTGGTSVYDTANGKGIIVTDTTTGIASFTSPAGISVDSNIYRRVKASVTLLSAPLPSTLLPFLRYSNGSHGFSGLHQKASTYPISFENVGDEVVLDFDMETSTDPVDWITGGPVDRISMSLTDTTPTGTSLRVNWVAIGANRPVVKPIGTEFVNKGQAVLDFTASNVATVSVTGQTWVTANSKIIASLRQVATATHSVDEHIMLGTMLGLSVPEASIVPGVGFDIVGAANTLGRVGGTVNVQWIGVV